MACTVACTSFFAKALFCQNPSHFDIPTTIPTIGSDPVLDTCLCVQGNVDALHSCAKCRATNNITNGDVTWVFLDACNKEFPDRHLWLSAAGPSLKPWQFQIAHGHGSTIKDKGFQRRLVDALNLYSVMLVISVAVSTCSVMLSG
ncbi:hypothetical protein BGZ46_010815 [Entomortierella lignicola]|nr:hypothetical protein BGZ46_010815 [Entomortierella lignicola]